MLGDLHLDMEANTQWSTLYFNISLIRPTDVRRCMTIACSCLEKCETSCLKRLVGFGFHANYTRLLLCCARNPAWATNRLALPFGRSMCWKHDGMKTLPMSSAFLSSHSFGATVVVTPSKGHKLETSISSYRPAHEEFLFRTAYCLLSSI